MNYTKTIWVNGTTPINDTNLNHIEDGIEQAAAAINSIQASIPTKTSDLINDSNFEVNTNKITSITASSTDVQYPSAKCIYNNYLALARQQIITGKKTFTEDLFIGEVDPSSIGAKTLQVYSTEKIYLGHGESDNHSDLELHGASVPLGAFPYNIALNLEKTTDQSKAGQIYLQEFQSKGGTIALTTDIPKLYKHVITNSLQMKLTVVSTLSTEIDSFTTIHNLFDNGLVLAAKYSGPQSLISVFYVNPTGILYGMDQTGVYTSETAFIDYSFGSDVVTPL